MTKTTIGPRLTPAQKALVRSAEAEQLVAWAARVYGGRFPEAERDEIVALAREALVLAARRYDPSRGASFATFASYRVRGHLTRELCAAHHRKAPIEALLAESERRRVVAGPNDDLAAAAQTPEQARQASKAWTDARCWELAIAAMLHPVATPTPEELAGWRQARAALAEGRAALPAEQALILRRRFDEGATMRSIAGELGKSTDTVHRQMEQALTALRWHLEGEGVTATEVAE